jgi:hypothetical protein
MLDVVQQQRVIFFHMTSDQFIMQKYVYKISSNYHNGQEGINGESCSHSGIMQHI